MPLIKLFAVSTPLIIEMDTQVVKESQRRKNQKKFAKVSKAEAAKHYYQAKVCYFCLFNINLYWFFIKYDFFPDDVIGRGLVSSSAAIDISGIVPDGTGIDVTGSGGGSIGDDVTRRDVTHDDVIKDEVKPWWMFAATACDTWRPPQHVYFQVSFFKIFVINKFDKYRYCIFNVISIFNIVGYISSNSISELRTSKRHSWVLLAKIYDAG